VKKKKKDKGIRGHMACLQNH